MTKRLLLALAACAGPRAAAASCSVEECEYQYDGMCDVDAGYCACDRTTARPRVDPRLRAARRGRRVLRCDALCAAAGEGASLATLQTFYKTATCDAGDYSTSCPSRPLPDPMYDAAAWYLAAINVEELSVADSCDHYLNAAATDSHGTHCAALAVGSSNDHCGVGVAYGASLASCRTLGESDIHDNPTAFAKGDVNSNSWGEDSCIVESDYDYDDDYYYDARRLEDACPFSSDVYDTPRADQGSKRERNSQLQRLISRPVSTRADAACADADFSRAGTLGEACKEAVVAYCSEGLKFEHDRDACLDLDRYYVVCSHNQIDAAGQDALKAGVADGRGGKGIVYVFAAGNEYTGNGNTNFEGYLNPRYVMTVGAVGVDLLHASYSSTGASVFVSAPGGDQGDVRGMVTANPVASGTSCGDATVGTSHATPIASGAAAMLEANPDLAGATSRASSLPPPSSRTTTATCRGPSTPRASASYQYASGVAPTPPQPAARTWTNYGQEAVLTAMASPGLGIADDGAAVSSTISAAADADFEVEAVVVMLTVDHPSRGDLRIILERGGVESLLAPESDEEGDGYDDWKYTTLRHWGESANGGGGWTLKVADVRAEDGPGTFVSWTLQVHGHAFAPTPKPTLAPVAAPTPKPVVAPEPTPEPTPKPTPARCRARACA
ncbi:serine-type endopeptidase [Aureococcus anophagefferens]|nr:serine-type endopeptidase [Aureococcus anophagefferens]